MNTVSEHISAVFLREEGEGEKLLPVGFTSQIPREFGGLRRLVQDR